MQQLLIELENIIGNAHNDALEEILKRYDITKKFEQTEPSNHKLIHLFLSAKRIEGKSEKTLHYYYQTITRTISTINKRVKMITTDDLRQYLSEFQQSRNSSNVTIDNMRRILSSFFSWLEDEDYIVKSPVRRIHKVKTTRVVKETFTDEDMEHMRDRARNLRDTAILEFLASSGVRVGELVHLNINDINFNERAAIVLGKGNSEREIYFDARTKIHLQKYLHHRQDNNPALFVANKMPYNRLTIGTIELIMKTLGETANITRVHPHKFRRTLATMAIDKGMPIEQVQKLLGHVRIDTTMHYAMVNQSNVKYSHRKYIG